LAGAPAGSRSRGLGTPAIWPSRPGSLSPTARALATRTTTRTRMTPPVPAERAPACAFFRRDCPGWRFGIPGQIKGPAQAALEGRPRPFDLALEPATHTMGRSWSRHPSPPDPYGPHPETGTTTTAHSAHTRLQHRGTTTGYLARPIPRACRRAAACRAHHALRRASPGRFSGGRAAACP
jgi:hypothetical protein